MATVAELAGALRRAPYLHAYELGDLDPAELPHTTWLASPGLDAIALIYRGLATPTLLALADADRAAARDLLTHHAAELPPVCYAHLSPGLEAALAPRFRCEHLSRNYKMGLFAHVPAPDPGAVRLTSRDGDEAVAFYAEAYPGSYFEPVCLERGPYLAVRDEGGIAAIAGVHVYSPQMRVASLGSIATRPDARGRGHARRATAALCHLLAADCDVIALNVRTDNAPAIACYRGLGFEVRHEYDEWRLTAR